MKFKESIVLKIGGSLLYDDELKLKRDMVTKIQIWVNSAMKKYNKIVLVIGGGKLSRFLGDQVKGMLQPGDQIHSVARAITVANAEIIRLALGTKNAGISYTLGSLYEKLFEDDVHCVVVGGMKDGWSTDMDAAVAADILDIDRVIKISDIDHIYTSDPRTNNQARVINDISWDEYFKLFGISNGHSQHKANLHIPIDMMCSQYCANKGINYLVTGGKNLEGNAEIKDALMLGTFVHI